MPEQKPPLDQESVENGPRELKPRYHAVMFPIKPGSAESVERVFANSPRPEPVIRNAEGQQIGLLISTTVFLRDDAAVRVMEFEGELGDVIRHLATQPDVHETNNQLAPFLVEERDMTTLEGTQAYFRRASMRCVLRRRYDE